MKRGFGAIAIVAVLGVVFAARADAAITFSGSSGTLAASVSFDVNLDGNLVVVLTNTSATDANAPANVLTAVFFDLPGFGALTPISALLTSGSTIVYDTLDSNGNALTDNVGGEWAYKSSIAGAPGGATEGISSSGLSPLFGDSNFNGPDLAPPVALDGVQYGLLPAGWVAAGDNGGLTGSGGLIQNSVTFTLSGIPMDFDPSASGAITNLSFQYGTALTEPNFPPDDDGGGGGQNPETPEAATLVMWSLLGAVSLGFCHLRRRYQAT
jgi:hypothetical protein